MPKFIENEVVREVPFEQVIERVIERIIPREVEVRVDKVIEVPVTIRGERAVTNERVEEQFVDFEARTLQAVPGRTVEEGQDIEDPVIEDNIRKNIAEAQRLQAENQRLSQEVATLRSSVVGFSSGYGRVEQEYLELKSRISELESRHSVIDQDRERLFRKSRTHTGKALVTVVQEDPQVENLRRELRGLIAENRQLVSQIRSFPTTNITN